MDESFDEWNDENSPYNVPEEIDLSSMLKREQLSIGDILEANGIAQSPNPMDFSELKNDDDMVSDEYAANVDDTHHLQAIDEQVIHNSDEEEEEGIEVNEEENEDEKQVALKKEEGKTLEEAFEEIYQKVINDPDADPSLRKNITVFMDNIQNARKAEQKVQAAYAATEELLKNSKTAILQAAVPLFDHLTVHMEKAEVAILSNFSESHKLRKTILAKMEECKKSWFKSFEELKSRLISTATEKPSNMPTPGLSVITEDETEADERSPDKANGEEVNDKLESDEVSDDLDWEEIIILAPNLKECIESFLACREKWSNAIERFEKALDTADEKISTRQNHMLEILSNAHRIIFDNLEESKENLMTLIVENHIKREALEEHVARKEAQHHKFFQKLFQSVKGKSIPKYTNDDEPVANKNSRKKMSSIRKVFKRSKGKKRPADSQDVANEE